MAARTTRQCHWHPDREAVAKCESCARPTCDSCSTDVGEAPESYRLCPECLTNLETLLDRGLNRQGASIPRWMPWTGALIGALLAFIAWMGAMFFIDPSWYTPLRWVGYLACALGAAISAVRFSRDYRGSIVVAATLGVVIPVIAVGHYISTNLLITSYLAANPEISNQLIETGAVARNYGWWLPFGVVMRMMPNITTWMDYSSMAAAAYLAYAFTHRRRIWQARKRWFS